LDAAGGQSKGEYRPGSSSKRKVSLIAKRFRGREIPVFMDIRWVPAKLRSRKTARREPDPIAHEFGHTLGSVRDAMANLDEYRKQSEHRTDVHRIMHRGSRLRDRHLEQLLTELYD